MFAEYQCDFKPSPQELKMRELAERYHAEAEAFDRTICTGPIYEGSILPATRWEAATITRNAHKLRQQIMDEAERYGITKADMARAIDRAA